MRGLALFEADSPIYLILFDAVAHIDATDLAIRTGFHRKDPSEVDAIGIRNALHPIVVNESINRSIVAEDPL